MNTTPTPVVEIDPLLIAWADSLDAMQSTIENRLQVIEGLLVELRRSEKPVASL